MDDYYLIWHDLDELKKMGHEIVRRFESCGIRVNKQKCKVIPLDRHFRFCKAKFLLIDTGAVKVHGCRDGMKRARRKLRSFIPKVKSGEMTMEAVKAFLQSQTSYYDYFDDHGRVLKLKRMYHAMYEEDNLCAIS